MSKPKAILVACIMTTGLAVPLLTISNVFRIKDIVTNSTYILKLKERKNKLDELEELIEKTKADLIYLRSLEDRLAGGLKDKLNANQYNEILNRLSNRNDYIEKEYTSDIRKGFGQPQPSKK